MATSETEERMTSSLTPKCAAASATVTRSCSSSHGTKASRKASLSRAWGAGTERAGARCRFSAMVGHRPPQSLDHRGPQLGGFDDEHLGAEARELVGEDRQIDVVHAQDAGGDLDRAAAVGQAYGGIRSRAHLDVGDPALPHRVELGEGTAHVVAGALGR